MFQRNLLYICPKNSVLRVAAPTGAFVFPKNDTQKKLSIFCLKTSVLRVAAPAGAFLFPKIGT